ncbi:hypothetical protein BN2364_2512 [Alloalcanivorax xenomutans]|nr:hypothetical protein BN2364_2512 [Alloalcanivorax xenomutans]
MSPALHLVSGVLVSPLFFYSWAGLPMSDIFFSKKFLQPEEIYKGQDN